MFNVCSAVFYPFIHSLLEPEIPKSWLSLMHSLVSKKKREAEEGSGSCGRHVKDAERREWTNVRTSASKGIKAFRKLSSSVSFRQDVCPCVEAVWSSSPGDCVIPLFLQETSWWRRIESEKNTRTFPSEDLVCFGSRDRANKRMRWKEHPHHGLRTENLLLLRVSDHVRIKRRESCNKISLWRVFPLFTSLWPTYGALSSLQFDFLRFSRILSVSSSSSLDRKGFNDMDWLNLTNPHRLTTSVQPLKSKTGCERFRISKFQGAGILCH